ncbi:hypothetical protein ASPSYDRAFT_1173145 [Aspergillus sydowii CBS 593.65]|uniref:Uncharacterized protein n=1 Tax=Aspergillus sydowii CBS 593.65 TaxID=1036612 RepID=A0A1L9TPX5_9EURO|nr:uncharacterized protein ASPSYDRAFT_1173145 [Aspergillus sydowii CBS 593.65]OJJ61445.1 hypothetical protein ASPSYDRAFT_1173145 [Aspergillus sydowii CBS 593.65]
MASESTSNLREEAVCNPPSPSNLCQQCKALYNSKLQQLGPHSRKRYLVPENTTPLIIWTEKHDRPNDSHHASWHSGNEFKEPIYKNIGKHCSDRGRFFLKSKHEIVTQPDKHREPISLMIDISQKLADKLRENPDKVKALLFDLPQPYGCMWAYDLPSHASLARFQWFPESPTPLGDFWAVRYIKDKESCSIM